MRVTTGVFFLFAVLCLAACHANADKVRSRAPAPGALAADEPAPSPLAGAFYDEGGGGELRLRSRLAHDVGGGGWDARALAAAGDAAAAPAPTPAAEERLLIQTGQVAVEVPRPDEVMDSFRTQVTAWGGHLSSQSDRTLVVRVPAARFDEAFAWVKNSGRVLSESRQAQDVTEEFLDLGIRIDNARKSRDRLLEILQKADKVEDILKVEAELRRLTGEIAGMGGRKKFLADQVTLATLSATFQAVAEAPPKKRRREPSRFDWINRIGAERMMEDF